MRVLLYLSRKYNPGPNHKLLPFFVTKGQRVKQSKEKNHTTITPPKCLKRTRVNRVIISKSSEQQETEREKKKKTLTSIVAKHVSNSEKSAKEQVRIMQTQSR
jgi:hypothetical protein